MAGHRQRALCLALLLAGAAAAGADPIDQVWVFFKDKPDGRGGHIPWQALGRGHAEEELDLPVDPRYVEQIRQQGIELRFCFRWFNAASVRATAPQQSWLEAQSFVEQVRPVARRQRRPEPEEWPAGRIAAQEDLSFEQLNQIGVEVLQGQGLYGQGVRIALLDNGFNYTGHRALEQVRILAERDFVNGDGVVSDQEGQPVTGDETRSSQNIHGTQVLALLAGRDPGRFTGAAPEAEYLLAKVEDNGSEDPVEEDRWIAGLEWADSLGARIVNSSLGYNIWDDGSGYTYQDLDGATALVSRAAQLAAEQGMVVVAAAGNEGDQSWRYVTAPADAPGVIAVGAVDLAGEIAGFSSRGPTADGRIKPDVVAPGVGVATIDARGGEYLRLNGTSFAAPLVSGACALLRQLHPSWDPAELAQALRQTATDLGEAGPDTAYGWGRANALRASGLQVELPQISRAGDPFPQPVLDERMTIYFPLELAADDQVELRIFDLAGGLVAQVPARRMSQGDYRRPERALRWQVSEQFADGIYFYQMRAATFAHAGRIALLRR